MEPIRSTVDRLGTDAGVAGMPEQRWRSPLSAGLLIGLLAAAGSTQPPPAEVSLPPAPPPALRAVGPQAGFGELLVLGSGGRFGLTAADAEHLAMLDGQPVPISALAGPWPPGRHDVSVQRAPAPGESPQPASAVQFVLDDTPPKLQFEVGDTTLL